MTEASNKSNENINDSFQKKLTQKIKLLKGINLFNYLTEQELKDLAQKVEILKYKIGLPLSDKNFIQNKISIIIEGEARLLSRINDDVRTISKLGPGSLIGLTSLIRNFPCEVITSSSEVITLSFPDESIIDLYKTQKKFKAFCDQVILPNEIIGLIELLNGISSSNNLDIKTIYNKLIKSSKLENIIDEKVINNDPNRVMIIASENIEGKKIGEVIENNTLIKSKSSIFQPRIISFDKSIYEEFTNENFTNDLNKTQKDHSIDKDIIDIEDALNLLPMKSGYDFNEYNKAAKSKLIRANGLIQETIATLEMLTNELNAAFRKDSAEKFLRDEIRAGKQISNETFATILSMHDLYVGLSKIPPRFGTRAPTPSLIHYEKEILLLKESSANGITIASPKDGLIKVPYDQLDKKFPSGIEILLVQKTNTTPGKNFNVGWFWPSLKKYKGSLLLVLCASFIVQLFGLANPLLIQVIIDKVISQRSLETLQVLGIALVVVTLLGGLLGGLRTFLFTETTNKIDTRLGAEIIDHLLRLPLKYFDKRPVGELSSRVAELEKIRDFLTGQALTTILDAAFSVIYIIVMFIYSNLLTFIALGVIPIQILLTLLGAPLIRRQIREVANQNARTQSHLVEVLTGIQTVKAQNVETKSRWKWQDLYGSYISRTFEKTITFTTLNQVSQVLQQLSQLLVLWVGASLVLSGRLTLGQLIAFRIISGYVTQPLLRLSSIWQSIQQLKVSFERLADIVDTPRESTEKDKTNIQLPQIKGKVEFVDVSFQFNPSTPIVLKDINLTVQPGQFVGIAGQSGSGKSTLMKVLPRLYELADGKILIDGFDVSKTELYSLRRQIGIVPQDPLLFSGTVSENIAVSNPDIGSDEIIKAAKISCSHDFIMTLPEGYSTSVGERGANLSGGQRQRLAIARTFLNKPNLLVMDEATSALDYQTEKNVCENLKQACKGTTVFFITHRLSTIKNSDLIIMMDNGYICEKGTHQELMDLKGRYYALYRQQESN